MTWRQEQEAVNNAHGRKMSKIMSQVIVGYRLCQKRWFHEFCLLLGAWVGGSLLCIIHSDRLAGSGGCGCLGCVVVCYLVYRDPVGPDA